MGRLRRGASVRLTTTAKGRTIDMELQDRFIGARPTERFGADPALPLLFRKVFFTDTASCSIRVVSVGTCRFRINGAAPKARSVSREGEGGAAVDRAVYDLDPYIVRNGKNVLSFELFPDAEGAERRFAFIMDQGERIRVFSGRSVKTAPEAFYARTPSAEEASADPPAWTLPAFDDGAWGGAEPVPCPGA